MKFFRSPNTDAFFEQYTFKELKMDTDDNFDRPTTLNLFAFFIESVCLYAHSLVRQTNYILRKFIENFQIAEYIDVLSDKLVEYPLLRFVVFATALSCSIPVVMFIVFGVTSILITFAGFLFIEGTLLAVGGLFMFVCIGTLILVLSILAMTLGIFYMLAIKISYVYSKFETTSNIMKTVAPLVSERNNPERFVVANGHQN